MIENLQKMRNFDFFSFWDVSDSFVPRVTQDVVDTFGHARPVCTEAPIFICLTKAAWYVTDAMSAWQGLASRFGIIHLADS